MAEVTIVFSFVCDADLYYAAGWELKGKGKFYMNLASYYLL